MWMQYTRLTGFKLAPMLQYSSCCLTTRKDMTICEMEYMLLKVSINSIKTSMDCGSIQYCFNQMFNLIDSDLYCRKIKTNHFYFYFFRAALLTFEGERFCTVGTLVVWE